jgi:LysR family glycine cleavage system transcriptional activator
MNSTRIPSLNWLRVFDAAARHQSFASAGRELNMSAAAVSQQILALETYLKAPLFQRSPNSIKLTSEGQEFLPTVQLSLRAIENKASALFPRKNVERVSLAASQLMAMSWLPRILSVFEQSNPTIRVDLLMEDIPRQAEPDLAIRSDQDAELVRHPGWLMGMTYVIVGKQEDLQRIEGPEVLPTFRLLEIRAHAVGWNSLLARYDGLPGEAGLMIDSVETTPLALTMLREGSGLALVPWPVSRPLVQSLGLAVCQNIPGVAGVGNYYIELSKRRASHPAVQALVEALRQAGAKDWAEI